MAIVWQKTVKGTHHEVRTAGNSLRLYTDGVFHSQYNPGHPAGGHLWDLLMLPVFFLEPEKVRRILVLGVGGGAVMRQLEYFTSARDIVGIDNNPWHLKIARQLFNVRGKPYQLLHADAVEWVADYSGESFDLVIDDLYGEQDGQPCRAIAADENWFEQLNHLLNNAGVLAINFLDRQYLDRSGWAVSRKTRGLFASARRLTMNTYENIIGVYCKAPVALSEFNARLRQHPELDRRRRSCRLNYMIRKLG